MIIELKKGKVNAIVILAIGENFEKYFDENIKTLYLDYCAKYNLGLLVVNQRIDTEIFNRAEFKDKIWLQTLFVPKLLRDKFQNYKYLAFMDADCIPSPVARNIFEYCKLDLNNVNLTHRSPLDFTKGNIGRRTSLLRKLYVDDTFPLDSLLSAEHEDDSNLFGLAYKHPTATIGTIVGHIDTITSIFDFSINSLLSNYRGYTQFNLNEASVACADINFLPYEFQAIWSTEISLYYPFYYINENKIINDLILQSVLLRVDFLHFAGAWLENDIYGKSGAFALSTDLNQYAQLLPRFLNETLQVKSYGHIKMRKLDD